MSGIWIVNPWTRLMLEADVLIYKSGYYKIGSMPWNALLSPWGEPVAGERKSYISEVEDGKPVIILKKWQIKKKEEKIFQANQVQVKNTTK